MKYMNKLIGLFLLLVISTASMAQSGKVGYVNSDAVISLLPSFKSAQTELETFANGLITPEMEEKQKELETRYSKFRKESATMSDTRREVEAQELMKLEQEYNKIAQPVQQQIVTKEAELMQPIQKEAQELISSVAKANGFSVVLDTRAGIIWAEENASLLPLIKTKLGVK